MVVNTIADSPLACPTMARGAVDKVAEQTSDPNALRWTQFGLYAQDQWTVNNKLTLNYGVRYELYPPAYRDHTGVTVLVPGLPLSANVEVGGVNGNPENSGISTGYGFFAPRIGFDYRLTEKTVVRSGFGLTADPDSMRYLRDEFPEDLTPNYSGTGTGTIAVDPVNTSTYASGQPMPLTYGIPIQTAPNYSSGFASLPVSGSTNDGSSELPGRGTSRAGIFFIQRGSRPPVCCHRRLWHFVCQQVGVFFNAAPFPSAN